MKINNIKIKMEDINVVEMLKIIETDERFKKFTKFNKMIILNGIPVDEREYETTIIKQDDIVNIVPILAGG